MCSIDVIIPNYNYGRYLRACVESALGQDIESLRVVVIDNASTDDSLPIARGLAARHAGVEIIAHETNRGAQASWNEAIDVAASDYFMILCADDLLAPGALRRAVDAMEQDERIAFTHGAEIALQGEAAPELIPQTPQNEEWCTIRGEDFIAASCQDPANYINGGTMVIRTAAQKRAGHFRPHLRYTDDLEMMLRLALQGRVAQTRAVQAIRRLHGANMSELYASERASELQHRRAAFESFLDHEGRTMPNAGALRARMHNGIASRAYWWAVRELLRGRAHSARELFSLSVSLRPATAIVPPVSYLFRRRAPLNAFAQSRMPISNPFRRA